MSTPNRRSTDSFYVKPQVNERPLRRATDSFVDGVATKSGNFVNKPIVSESLSKAIPIRKETLPSRPVPITGWNRSTQYSIIIRIVRE